MAEKFPPLGKNTPPIVKNKFYKERKGNGRQERKYKKYVDESNEKLTVEEKFGQINFDTNKIKKLTRYIVEKLLDRDTYHQIKISIGEGPANDGENRKDLVEHINSCLELDKSGKHYGVALLETKTIHQIMEYFQKLGLEEKAQVVFPDMDFQNFEGKGFNTIKLDYKYKGEKGLIKLKQEIVSFFERQNKSTNLKSLPTQI